MNRVKGPYLIYFILLLQLTLIRTKGAAQGRIVQTINSNWEFQRGDIRFDTVKPLDANRQAVNLPHSWNKEDVNDEIPGYYRGIGWYSKKIFIPEEWKTKELYLQFKAVNQFAEVYVNGKKAGSHTGGYTAFNVNITPFLDFGPEAQNEISIKADNSHDENIPPLSADFTFFGGIYRDVQLSALNKIHFNMMDHASSGVFIHTPMVSAEKAQVRIRGTMTNATGKIQKLLIINTIRDQQGTLLSEKKTTLRAAAFSRFEHHFSDIVNPKLWSPEHPNLYTVTSVIQDISSGEILDQIIQPLAFRWFKFDPDKGFFLNGRPLKLVGASRHQDFKNMANAVPAGVQVRDVELLKEMGGNFLRIAHYPQDEAVLNACDRLGILTSVEIPIVNTITESEEFRRNCLEMQTEMIRQNFNHPSVIIWAYMNEVLLRPRFLNDSLRKETYFKSVAALAREIEKLTRSEDPQRYTMIPNHGNFNLYHRVGLTTIPMLVGWNLYQGWYSGKLTEFSRFLDMHHKVLPDKPLLVTEYGSDADIRIHSDSPERFDKSVEYTRLYHEAYLKAMLERPFVAAAIAWNLSDFNSEERRETDPHINNKGLLTIGRKPKDAYYFYQANLLDRPFIKIGSSDKPVRSGIAGRENTLTQDFIVYSNQPFVALRVNGVNAGEKQVKGGMVQYRIECKQGLNSLEAYAPAEGRVYRDQYVFNASLVPQNLKSHEIPFQEINISLGDKRKFYDEQTQQVWLPEQEYRSGSWGYKGGRIYKMPDTSRQSFGSTKDILGTDIDPVYQTQRVGIKEFTLDVPDGSYEVTLHLAELHSGKQQEALAYNLGKEPAGKELFERRSFDVQLNGTTVLSTLGNNNYLLPEQACAFKIQAIVNKNEGIHLNFIPRQGEAILNGIQVKRKL
ncbi:glycoside hydrolase family 2 TIM barrel-domain containing protein [Desertivirga xinjiangensis]|uniref:glycoside hydrolase family 2 TIM barrel-domain containing protein n=1 Tax=Desertivirga xinjiangensis TaxID=539206 RepID=UPI00210E4436|nr:glycoside hydrolase family 2 TIM barrel-domain containing protein [Pedobacter xinjiangensis]